MTTKIGRNDPCSCGSGKKYKQCCAWLPPSVESVRKSHDGAIPRAIAWLESHHRKAILFAIDEMLLEGLSLEEQDILESLDQDTMQGIHLNATEWLLAEGSMLVKEVEKRVVDVLLDKGGPLFTVEQRQWIQQLSEQPLRLYDVTDVLPNQQMTLCDALNIDADPVIVKERSGSQISLIGNLIGARLMQVDGHVELSGGVYPFSRLMTPNVLQLAQHNLKLAKDPKDQQALLSHIIRRKWLEQFIRPTIPTMIDAQSGKPMLFTTDHYRVNDWDALSQALESRKDIDGDRYAGWSRLKTYPDGLTRSTSNINISKTPDRIELFHRTEADADKGRKWFDQLAGETVVFVAREISDPMGMLNDAAKKTNQAIRESATTPTKAKKANNDANNKVEIDADLIANLIEQRMHQFYAKWCDQAIPALGDKTPRQAIKTVAGLERVKGLLRSYEESEEIQAKAQGRRAISFEFLWTAIGLKPD